MYYIVLQNGHLPINLIFLQSCVHVAKDEKDFEEKSWKQLCFGAWGYPITVPNVQIESNWKLISIHLQASVRSNYWYSSMRECVS